MDKFINRQEAGIILAKYLGDYVNQPNVLVLALPRGGVPVAYEIAQTLCVPLDVFVVRKLGTPGHEELAMGAIASGDTVIFNQLLLNQLHVEQTSINAVLNAEKKELIRREHVYRGNRAFPVLTGKTVILVDDGIATGATMHAAVTSLRKHKPASIIIAVPVAAQETYEEMINIADDIICPLKPINFQAVGLWYNNFPQVSDEEVIELLEKSQITQRAPPKERNTFKTNETQAVKIPSADVSLDGLIYSPNNARGLVLFVHGSGSSRFSTRNQFIAKILNEAGFATLLFDLLTPDEEIIDNQTCQFRFDIKLLASRLIDVTQWCRKQPNFKCLNVGYFGASTGGSAALVAAASKPYEVQAIVSRGGRPDLAGDSLEAVHAPTLLIVGGEDKVVIQLNQKALNTLNCTKKIDIIPGATHLFEEPGALDEVSRLTKDWFVNYLSMESGYGKKF